MKKIGALTLAFATIICSLLTLSSCSKKSDIPEGMQLVYGNDASGYRFYAPEEWTVSNLDNIKSAYISKLDITSVSFAEVDPIPTEIGIDETEYFFGSYFSDSLSEFPEKVKPEVTVNGEETVFGKEGEKADRAIKYVYSYEYSDHKFGFMQILMSKGDRFFIFTYTALLEEKSEGVTYYEHYLEEKVVAVIDNFRFTEVTEDNSDTVEYEKDEDGYSLISDPALSGFSLYVPDGFLCDYSSAVVSATHADGSNLNMSEATMTGNNMTVGDYWKIRKAELSTIVGEITEIKFNEPTSVGNSKYAFSFEYTFTYNGEQYHVYQVLAVEGFFLFQNGYVFTYTAKEANYSLHFDSIKTVLEKVDFR